MTVHGAAGPADSDDRHRRERLRHRQGRRGVRQRVGGHAGRHRRRPPTARPKGIWKPVGDRLRGLEGAAARPEADARPGGGEEEEDAGV